MRVELKEYRPCGGALRALRSSTLAQNRPIAHRVHYPDLSRAGVGTDQRPFELVVDGPEAHHAGRVKRLRAGEQIELFDGQGMVAQAEVRSVTTGKRAGLVLMVAAPVPVGRVSPRVEVWCPPPKGDRLETMIEQLSQLGVAAWHPLRAERTERDEFRRDKVERAAIESAKQCGRAWIIEIGAWTTFDDALHGARCVLADASGIRFDSESGGDTALLLGPEGGWTAGELDRFRATGRPVVRFGPHVMRIETAAVAAAGVLLAGAE